MKILVCLILFLSLNIKSAELIWDIYGNEEIVANYKFQNKLFLVYKSKNIVNTSIGLYGTSTCGGTIEIIEATTKNNFVCEVKTNNHKVTLLFNKQSKGDMESATNGFDIVQGTGPWEEMVGQSCYGAYFSLKEESYMWKGKCKIPDKTIERMTNYKNPE